MKQQGRGTTARFKTRWRGKGGHVQHGAPKRQRRREDRKGGTKKAELFATIPSLCTFMRPRRLHSCVSVREGEDVRRAQFNCTRIFRSVSVLNPSFFGCITIITTFSFFSVQQIFEKL